MLRADVYTIGCEITSSPQNEAIPVIMLIGVGHALNMKLSQIEENCGDSQSFSL
jgi:hypothetical protein